MCLSQKPLTSQRGGGVLCHGLVFKLSGNAELCITHLLSFAAITAHLSCPSTPALEAERTFRYSSGYHLSVLVLE